MEINLHPETAQFIRDQIEAGHYTDINEVIEDALNQLQNRKLSPEERAAKLERLRKDIQIGIDQLDRGEGRTWNLEEILTEARKRFNEKTK
jgi:antitoxin ParD1/3/4